MKRLWVFVLMVLLALVVSAPVSAHEDGHEEEDEPVVPFYCSVTVEAGTPEFEFAFSLLSIDDDWEPSLTEEIPVDFLSGVSGDSIGVTHCRYEMKCICLQWLYLPAPSNPVCVDVACGAVPVCD